MFSNIKTSKDNKEIVTRLTNRLNLGAENIIARIALAYSLAQNRKFDLSMIGDSSGKEYSAKILFGENIEYYIALVAVHYHLYKSDKDIARYIKMHIDDGLQLIHQQIDHKIAISGSDFLINEIEKGLPLI